MDILDRIDVSAKEYSDALARKLKMVTKSSRHLVRKVTDAEASELGGIAEWFVFSKRQCVLERRACGQWIVWAF